MVGRKWGGEAMGQGGVGRRWGRVGCGRVGWGWMGWGGGGVKGQMIDEGSHPLGLHAREPPPPPFFSEFHGSVRMRKERKTSACIKREKRLYKETKKALVLMAWYLATQLEAGSIIATIL